MLKTKAPKKAMRTVPQKKTKKKLKNVKHDVIQGKIGMIYIPDQQVGGIKLYNNAKGLKRERCKRKMKKEKSSEESKKQKVDSK